MGGKSAPAPDYSQLAAVSQRAIDVGERLGQQQIDFASRQYEEMKPILTGLANTMQESQQQQMQQAKDYYDYQVGTFRPLEEGLVKQAREFNTADYREQMAREAAAAAGKAFSTTEAANQRAMASMGVNPNSGKAMAMRNATQLGLSAQRAGAMTGARQQAEQMGWARQMDAAGLGRNLAGASTAAYQGANQAGASAAGVYQQPGSAYMSGLSQGAGTMQTGIGQGITGYGNILGNQTSVYNNAQNAQGEFWGSLLGAGATLGGAYLGKSDVRLKENIKQVGSYEQFGLPMYEFEYKGGSGQRYRGVMAQDVEKVVPEAVFEMPDGFKAVNYTMLGIDMIKV